MSTFSQHVTRHTHRLVVSVIVLTAATSILTATSARAQADLIDRYRAERLDARLRTARRRPDALAPRAPVRVPPPADSLRLWLLRQSGWTPPKPLPPLDVRRWRSVPRLARGWFEKEHRQTHWTFSGTVRLTPLDTLFTPKLRARLQDRFGPPTHTIGDFNPNAFRQVASPAQFEYWLVVNDSIPLKVMDVNGPFERGLVVATDRRYRRLLYKLRDALEAELTERAEPAPFVDYYHLAANDGWFRAGYNGSHYFIKPIDAPNLHLGRPWLSKENGAPD